MRLYGYVVHTTCLLIFWSYILIATGVRLGSARFRTVPRYSTENGLWVFGGGLGVVTFRVPGSRVGAGARHESFPARVTAGPALPTARLALRVSTYA